MDEIENYVNMLRRDKVESLIKYVIDFASTENLTYLEILQALRSVELAVGAQIANEVKAIEDYPTE